MTTQRPRVVTVCKYLRTKAAYIGDEGCRDALAIRSDTALYWCNRTGEPLGPDADLTGPEECTPARSCFVGIPLVLSGKRQPSSDRSGRSTQETA
ncbi:MAG: hypothetical protein KatS3mg115_0761 [Candidatus Poribacteria bacterium]|nr:MAG: hypothetical protein KatS3mg115_0761 [Candidatus Poribacteria bacterium]